MARSLSPKCRVRPSIPSGIIIIDFKTGILILLMCLLRVGKNTIDTSIDSSIDLK